MYRVFCESYENFLKTFKEESYRLKIAKPFELIINNEKYQQEKEVQSDLYKSLCSLLDYMQRNINRFPRFKAFLWILKSRNIVAEKFNNEKSEDLEEQSKLINSFLKLAYWY